MWWMVPSRVVGRPRPCATLRPEQSRITYRCWPEGHNAGGEGGLQEGKVRIMPRVADREDRAQSLRSTSKIHDIRALDPVLHDGVVELERVFFSKLVDHPAKLLDHITELHVDAELGR